MVDVIKRKVLFFTSPEVGGAERMTITIGKMLDTSLYEVKFIVVGRQKGNIIKFIPEQFPVKHLKIKSIWDFSFMRIYWLMKKEKPKVVFCSLIYLNIRVILAAKLSNAKVIVRNNIGLDITGKLNLTLCKLAYPKADVVIAQQEEMRKDILTRINIDKDKVMTLHNPLDTDTIDSKLAVDSPYLEDVTIKYVWVGRISHEKGQDYLIKAFKLLNQTNGNSKLFFIGKYSEQDAYYGYLKQLVNDLGLANSVTFVGFDNNPYRWVKYCNCFVQPSRKEGLPNALVEAMYIGKPVVATRCIPVIDRIVKDGYNGFVVDVEDVEGMAEAMKKALDLHDFSTTYKSAKKEDFTILFS